MGDSITLILDYFVNGAGQTGKSPVVAVYKKSTGEWLNDAKDGWQAEYNDIAMAELDSTNLAGIYTLDITHIDQTSEEYMAYFKVDGYVSFESHLFTGEVYVPASSSYATGTIRGLLDTMRNKDVNRTFDQSTDSLEAIRDNWTATALLNGTKSITLQLYETDTVVPIADANVTVMNSDETLLLTRVETDTNGQAVIDPDPGTYKLRIQKAGWTFTVPETLVVTGDDTATLYGTPLVVSAPDDPDVCRVYDYLALADDETYPATVDASATITKLPHDWSGKLHSGDEVEPVYDSNTGLIYWDLVQGAQVKFDIKDFIKVTKVVPQLTTKRLAEL
jgi:hypothetical protein